MRYVSLVILGAALLAAGGCGGDPIGRTVPVTGKVIVDGKPLSTGSVTFWPEESKGDNSKLEATGQIGKDGTYTLNTRGKPGAPPGRYKVTVTAQAEPDAKNPYAPPKHLINPSYAAKETTSLKVIEVVENPAPDAYDLIVTR